MSKFRIQMLVLCASLFLTLGIATHVSAKEYTKAQFEPLLSSEETSSVGKYEEVSQIMQQVFSGGRLDPASPAVRHAADVDMPARGGTPQKLLVYLRTASVRKWYCDNFGLR